MKKPNRRDAERLVETRPVRVRGYRRKVGGKWRRVKGYTREQTRTRPYDLCRRGDRAALLDRLGDSFNETVKRKGLSAFDAKNVDIVFDFGDGVEKSRRAWKGGRTFRTPSRLRKFLLSEKANYVDWSTEGLCQYHKKVRFVLTENGREKTLREFDLTQPED